MKYLSIFLLVLFLLACRGGKRAEGLDADSAALVAPEDTLTPESNPAVFQARFDRGIDFAATGNEPFWSLDIDFNGEMHFKLLDGPEIIAPTPEAAEAMDADITRYSVHTNHGSMTVQLIRLECIDGMSGARSPYTVRVGFLSAADASPSNYEGCGRYLADQRLGRLWTLESINGVPLDGATFAKGSPQLDFDLDQGRVSGHTGCNNIGGAVEVQGHRIDFKPMIATKMACPEMEFERDYLGKFAGVVEYRVEAGKLVLQVTADSTFTYRTTN